MANPTNPFNWQMPQSTDLVTDLPADFETFGQAVATSMADLLGGTTGQVLSKASNTDMDFTWVAQDDANAIQNTIVDAKGDLIAATAADTPARLAVGANGETLVADSSTSTGLRYQSNFAAGKNKCINGDFGIWQRGTSFSVAPGGSVFTADRYNIYNGAGGTTVTASRQSFTSGTAPVAGYEGTFFHRLVVSGFSSGNIDITQAIEDGRTFAGQTVTLSFWAKAAATTTLTNFILLNTGSGGSGGGAAISFGSISVTTSWVRYTMTGTMPSAAGNTFGTGSFIQTLFRLGSNATLDIWGVQLEAGSVATAFQTATGTIQGELAACQRYYEKSYNTDVAPGTNTFTGGFEIGGSSAGFGDQVITIKFAVAKRGAPTMKAWTRGGVANQFTYAKSGASADVAASFIYAGFTQTVAYAPVGANFIASTLSGHWTAEAEL